MLTHKPRKGSWVCWPGDRPYQINEVRDDGIATMIRPGEKDGYGNTVSSCFIYKFRDGWNRLAFHCTADGTPLPTAATETP